MNLNLSDYNFHLPKEKIALYPLKNREMCKLLYADCNTDTKINTTFNTITQYFKKNDILVLNNTMVDKARFYSFSEKKNKHEILLLEEAGNSTLWKAKIKNRKKLTLNQVLTINEKYSFTLLEKYDDDLNLIKFSHPLTQKILDEIAELPLPPYIIDKRPYDFITDNEFYQTVFYSKEFKGSKASPTAGLHFTENILKELSKIGVIIVPVQLFVSLGTFNPIKTDSILDHTMHYEKYHISEQSATLLNTGLKNNARIIAVGTTALRTLESAITENGYKKGYGNTNLFIKPGFTPRVVSALITNFHTPKSSLLVLVATLMGYSFMKECYDYAINNNFRFFSYGDAMFIDNIKSLRYNIDK